MGKNNSGFIDFDTRIYKPQSINLALKEFSDFGEFHQQKKINSIRVNFTNVTSSKKSVIIGELSNYILAITKKCL